jgi:hypothetical protein
MPGGCLEVRGLEFLRRLGSDLGKEPMLEWRIVRKEEKLRGVSAWFGGN